MPSARRFTAFLLPFAVLAANTRASDVKVTETSDEPRASYSSPFAAYRGYRDEPLRPWRDSNELARRLGGWKAFAGGQEPKLGEREAKPAKAEAQPAPAGSPEGHSGHGARK